MKINQKNYAFIDAQNLYLNIRSQGWKLDYLKFRKYLNDKYSAVKVYMFLGFISKNRELYDFLSSSGYILLFKPNLVFIKGNCDVELTVESIIKSTEYDKAIIVSGDGDFFYLAKYLHEIDKLGKIMVPDKNHYSKIFHDIETSNKRYVSSISDLRNKVEYKQKSARRD